jgi:hypothetical protein
MSDERTNKFDPSDHLVEIDTKQGKKPYLAPRHAITWFYIDHPLPEGRVTTTLISSEPLIMRAEVWIGEAMVATGHANMEGNSNTLKKIESSAIRRALANAGYGTDQVIARIARAIPLDTAKKMLGAGKERRITGTQPTPHWANNGGGERMNDVISKVGLKWEYIKDKMETGKILSRLQDTALSEEAFIARLNVIVNERDNALT